MTGTPEGATDTPTGSVEPDAPAGQPTPQPASRPVGRPPRISRDAIAAAAREIGLADLSLRRVAEHLGVSAATLYHHIDGKDDLLRLAANDVAREIVIPADEGQSWPRWLADWGRYNFEIFADRPELFDQFLRGGIRAEVIADNTELVLSHLVALGFGVVEAAEAYEIVSYCAIGSAVSVLRERAPSDGPADLLEVLAERAPEDLPHMRVLAAARQGEPFDPSRQFEASLRTVIVGIGMQRGESAADVIAALDA